MRSPHKSKKRQIKTHWNNRCMSEYYDRLRQSALNGSPHAGEILRELNRMQTYTVSELPKGNLLEVGPSNSPQLNGEHTSYVDHSKPALDKIKQGKKIHSDVEEWIPNRKFDGAATRFLLHYVEDRPAFVKKMASALKPGSSWLITESPKTFGGTHDEIPHFGPIGREELIRLLKENKFDIHETHDGVSGLYLVHAKKSD